MLTISKCILLFGVDKQHNMVKQEKKKRLFYGVIGESRRM